MKKQSITVVCKATLAVEIEATSVSEASRKFHKLIGPVKNYLVLDSIDVTEKHTVPETPQESGGKESPV